MGRRLFDEVTTPDQAQGWVVSASQIKRWKECPRAWGFEYLEGLRPPPSKAAALGSAVHYLLELYFKGEPWPEDADAKVVKLAQAVIDSGTLPSPGFFIEPENVERSFMLRTGPIQIRGFIDLIVPRARPPLVADHKTSSDPAKYGLTPETLGDDIQATIYAAAVLDLLGVDEVSCQWTYCKTRGRAEVHPVRATLDRERTRENLAAHVLPPTREILDTVTRHEAGEVDPIDLRPVPESCGNWGGCPHAEYCPRSRDQLLTASGWNTETENTEQKENETMSLIEMLKAKKAAQAATAPTPAEAPAPEAMPEPKPAKAKKLPPPRINSPEHDAAKTKAKAETETPAPVEVAPEAPAPAPSSAVKKIGNERPELDRAGLIEAIKAGPVTVAKSRGRAEVWRPFVPGKVIKSLIADGIAVVEDVKGGRLVTDSRTAPEATPEAAPEEAPEAAVEATPEPTPTEAPAEPAPVTAAPATSEEAPLGRRLVALYMRKDGKIIVEIDPAGIPE